jgi:hypothetical protein
MGFAELELVPASGMDLAAIEAHLRATPHAFVDPYDPACWFLCEDEPSKVALLQARLADPTRRPYALLLLLEAERLWLIGEFADADELAVGRRLVAWLLSTGAWTARDAAYSGPWAEPLSFFDPTT